VFGLCAIHNAEKHGDHIIECSCFNIACDACLQALIKPQYIDHISRAVKGSVEKIIDHKDEKKIKAQIAKALGLCVRCVWYICCVCCVCVCAVRVFDVMCDVVWSV